jgi:hypothetical protein
LGFGHDDGGMLEDAASDDLETYNGELGEHLEQEGLARGRKVIALGIIGT